MTVASESRTTAVGIVGTGAYLPAEVITNAQIAESSGVTEEWILSKTGIRTRRRAAPQEATSDLAFHAAEQALGDAGLRPDQLSLLIVSTITPDGLGPSTACVVAGRLGCPLTTAAFDMSAACSGFVYSLAMARQHLLASGGYALIVAADVYTRFVNPKDKHIAVLWGDGAGAVVLGPVGPDTGILRTKLLSDGANWDLAGVRAGLARMPATAQTVDAGLHFMHMDGRKISEILASLVPGQVQAFLDECECPPHEVTHLVPHQGNANLVLGLPTLLGLEKSRLHLSADRYGNTGSASIPITLHEALQEEAFQPGDLVLFAAFGIGVTLGFALIRWPHRDRIHERKPA
ncbi:ketoacyl-ACP synthase III [Actinocrinis sp.]|uniref:3-oxoacyl-ACP synthase III family protein n=1 Tax=Actinocrinis sp. TaxID=1920516 RepID=UPI002D3C5C5F|nr:ketoacyl-ACP synthase III [Actinocrinis sp.]HZP51759.1 ketoacyl-ACP synthase III [Actinocrinis sp.]